MSDRWSIACVTLVAGLALTGCSSDHKKLSGDCSTVFSSVATDAEGTCQGVDGAVHIHGIDCSSGPELMAAEDSGGGDKAWARVGGAWHVLSEEGTYDAAFGACQGG